MIDHTRLAAVNGVATVEYDDVNPMSMVERLPEVSVPVGSLVPGFHLRASGVDPGHVQLLADAAGSARLPSILVQKSRARIIDGMHRFEVAKLRGERSIEARIVDCTDEEALVLAVKANILHGLPLSRADRIAGAKRILAVRPDWSDRAVAGITGLRAKTIASLRNSSASAKLHSKRLGQDGRRRPVVPGEASLRAAEYIAAHPEASVRQVARETDVSVGTAQRVREGLRRGTQRLPEGQQSPNGAVRDAADILPGRGNGLRHLTWSVVAPKLTSDPALRYTEGGRAFLQWMASHSMHADEWREFVDAVPARWLDDVRGLAMAMSEEWHQFADWAGYRQEAAGLAEIQSVR